MFDHVAGAGMLAAVAFEGRRRRRPRRRRDLSRGRAELGRSPSRNITTRRGPRACGARQPVVVNESSCVNASCGPHVLRKSGVRSAPTRAGLGRMPSLLTFAANSVAQ